MSESSQRCGSCHGVHANPLAFAGCAYEHELHQVVRDAASRSEQPPPPALVDDLWAHLNGIYDRDAARRAVQYVLDLGWRPVDFSNTPPSPNPESETKP